jgi:hypothetical protein
MPRNERVCSVTTVPERVVLVREAVRAALAKLSPGHPITADLPLGQGGLNHGGTIRGRYHRLIKAELAKTPFCATLTLNSASYQAPALTFVGQVEALVLADLN